MDDMISMFMDITSVADTKTAQQFIEMSGGDIESAVSLYFEHGSSVPETPSTTTAIDDEQLAQQLQQEMYKDGDDDRGHGSDEIRRPIEPTHDTLLPEEFRDYQFQQQQYVPAQGGMFGRAERSVFNQNVIDLDSDGSVSNDDEDVELNGMSTTQRRLANIFRPPWDIIRKIDLSTAKKVAVDEGKWILINIQDVTDFRCQCLNRDFWSNQQIKEIVSANFVFLQYHHDSPSGEAYTNFYPINGFPHIAVIDPVTGERMLVWNEIPMVIKWIQQVVELLEKFDDGDCVADNAIGLNIQHPVEIEDEEEQVQEREPSPAAVENPTTTIQSINHPDPPADIPASETTRVQIRAGDGRRVVKKMLLSDSVLHLFEFVKFYFELPDSSGDDGEESFTLKIQGRDLSDCLDDCIADAGLKNASVMLELL